MIPKAQIVHPNPTKVRGLGFGDQVAELLPDAGGFPGQVLRCDGEGQLSWADPARKEAPPEIAICKYCGRTRTKTADRCESCAGTGFKEDAPSRMARLRDYMSVARNVLTPGQLRRALERARCGLAD